MSGKTATRLAIALGLLAVGCATATMAGYGPLIPPQDDHRQMRLPEIDVRRPAPEDQARLRNISSDEARPRERAGLPDCGLVDRPFTIFPGLGGDTVTFGEAGTFYVYDEGDQSGGPDLAMHDKIILPGTPDEPDILIGENSVSFCYVERRIAITLFRQLCAGEDWNNSVEAFSFDEGVTFVDPRVLSKLAPGELYLTPDRLKSMSIDWLSEEAIERWQVRPMPEILLPSASAVEQCEADTQPLPANWKPGSEG